MSNAYAERVIERAERDDTFRQQLMEDPRAAISADLGIELPEPCVHRRGVVRVQLDHTGDPLVQRARASGQLGKRFGMHVANPIGLAVARSRSTPPARPRADCARRSR